MNKKLFILFSLLIILLSGCTNKINQNDGKERIYLNKEYYNKGEFIKVNSKELDSLDGSFVIFTHNSFCSMGVPCEDIFKSFMEKYKIDFIKIEFDLFKESKYYEFVKYAPSIIIVKNGKVVAYLDANSDDDIDKYQDTSKFEKWIDNYIYFKEEK